MSLGRMVAMGFNKYGPWILDILNHVAPTVALWEGQNQPPRDRRPHPPWGYHRH